MAEQPEEQLEFLRREDIRTMGKDMARLREEESKKEREKIIQIQGAPKGQQAVPQGQTPAATPEPSPVSLMPSGLEAIRSELPKPPSKTKKVVVRAAIILLILFVAANAIALAYSFWKGAGSKQQEQAQPPQQISAPEGTLPPQEESLLPFPVEKIVAVSTAEDLSQLLSQELPRGITGVSFEGVPAPLAFLGIELSEQVRPLVRPSFLLFLHTLGEKKQRFGLAFTIEGTPEAVKEAVAQWEPAMEKNTAPFFQLMGGPGVGYVSFFRSTQHNGIPVRFQTFSRNDVGIVYAISHNLFIITSSLESMDVLLDTLEKPAL